MTNARHTVARCVLKLECLSMNIKAKVTLGAILLTAVPVLISVVLLGAVASSAGSRALQAQVEAQLVALRETKRAQVEDYLATVQDQVLNQSVSPNITQLMQEMSSSAQGMASAYRNEMDNYRSALQAYYEQDVSGAYAAINDGRRWPAQTYYNTLDDIAVFLQFAYMADSELPIGRKHESDRARLIGSYDFMHRGLHSYLNDFVQRFGYADLYLINDEGFVFYTVQKHIDFGVNLRTQFADSGLARVHQRVVNGERGVTYMEDFSAYVPRYDHPTAFIGTQVHRDDGRLLGALVIALSEQPLNQIMTNGEAWVETGYGQTGETLLVGRDGITRSLSRPFAEQPDATASVLRQTGVTSTMVDDMLARGTSVGLMPVTRSSIAAALSGESGVVSVRNAQGDALLSAFAPVSVNGLEWVVLSEVSEREAFADIRGLVASIRNNAAIFVSIMIVLAVLAGLWFARSLVSPILRVANTIKQIGEHADLTLRTDVQGRDEVGTMAVSLNGTLDRIHQMVTGMRESADRLAEASTNLDTAAEASQHVVATQQAQSSQIASATVELQAVVHDVSNNANQASAAARAADASSTAGQALMNDGRQAMRDLERELTDTAGLVQRVETDASNIGQVLDVIRAIAEQTNLLALNAAIESARAGEVGRGFAVVADEVRMLAGRTQKSLDDIHDLVERLQTGAKEAAVAMNQSQTGSQTTTEKLEAAGQAFDEIRRAVADISAMNVQIADAAGQQSLAADEINRSIMQLTELTETSSDNSRLTADAGKGVSQVSADIRQWVDQFRA